MSPAKKRTPTLPARRSGPKPEGDHTCRRCPACAGGTCEILQDLGTYCETQWAASQANPAAEEAAARDAAA